MTRRFALALLLFVSVTAPSCAKLLGPSGKADYSITGTATRVDITYSSNGGGTSQASNVSLPWSYSLTDLKKDDFLYVSAQIVNTSGGSITVTINKDGNYFKSGTATGFPSIATASGSS